MALNEDYEEHYRKQRGIAFFVINVLEECDDDFKVAESTLRSEMKGEKYGYNEADIQMAVVYLNSIERGDV